LSLFFVKLLKGEFPISRGTTVTHGYSTPTNAAEQGSSTIRVICSSEELLGVAACISKLRMLMLRPTADRRDRLLSRWRSLAVFSRRLPALRACGRS
jgi:hypothetical protein